MHLDALKLAASLRERLAELALELGAFRDPLLRAAARDLWRGPPELGGLVGDPWVEGAFPAQSSGLTLRDLRDQGEIDATLVAQLETTGAMPQDRPLYTHQRDAILLARSGTRHARPGLVVTAGTGAGKTESFLLPMLDVLWRSPGQHGQGVSALLLYPMNALVIDQVNRLSSWLKGQSRVTFFHFTSETPEDHKVACDLAIEPREMPYFRTRKQARGLEDEQGVPLLEGGGRQPDVVVTNYSMLEYMLCRPQDGVFFGENLRVVVLDEAHLYNGTLAAEIALLLRRLLERCGKRPEEILFLAASATLGTGTEHEILGQLRQFGASLSSKDPASMHAIVGQVCAPSFDGDASDNRVEALAALDSHWTDVDTLESCPDGQPRLRVDPEGCAQLRELLVHLGVPAGRPLEEETRPAALLHRGLPAVGVLRHAARVLFDRRRLSLKDLSSALWGSLETEEKRLLATTRLLTLGASARQDASELPLLPHRIHLPVRGTDGLSVCLNPACSAPSRLPGRGALLGGHREICPFCRSVALPLLQCDACGEPLLVSREPGTTFPGEPTDPGDRVRGWVHTKPPKKSYVFCLEAPGKDAKSALKIDPGTGEINGDAASVELWPVAVQPKGSRCPSCQELISSPSEVDPGEMELLLRPVQSGAPLTTLLVTETILPALPPIASSLRAILPAEGRRLLAFSDSRRSAARLGPQLTDSHGRRLFQATLTRFLLHGPLAEDLESLQEQVELFERQLARKPNQQATRENLEDARNKLTAAQQGHLLESLPLAMASHLPTDRRLSQLPALELADKQEAPWDAQKWQDNRQQVLRPDSLLALLGRELARRGSAQRSLEGLGLVEIVYPGLDRLSPPDSLLAVLPRGAREALASSWPTLVALLCDTLRADGAITLGSKERDEAYSFGENWLGRWVSEEQAGWRTSAFVGMQFRQVRRSFASAILLKMGVSPAQVDELSQLMLRGVFHQLHGGDFRWIEASTTLAIGHDQTAHALRLKLPSLAAKRPTLLWQSKASGKVWSRVIQLANEAGIAPEPGCSDMLQVSHEDLDEDPRIGRRRRELSGEAAEAGSPDDGSSMGRGIFDMALWAEEHSAQRSPRENRRLQGLFEVGARNVLSASTTLEVGIDIGGLNGVLMANAPPGKASYLQRSGRAGRRTDGSSAVVVFCHPRPFDREVFLRFDRYLGRALRRPRVLFERERIARRHAHAWLLGEFFRAAYGQQPTGAMQAFGRMGTFLGLEIPAWWDAKSLSKPPLPAPTTGALCEQFCQFLRQLALAPTPELSGALAFLLEGTPAAASQGDLSAFLLSVETDFLQAIESSRQDLLGLRELYDKIPSAPGPTTLRRERSMALALLKQLGTLSTVTVIEALSDRQFLPKFGFPVGLHRLKVMVPDETQPRRLREDDSIRLERVSLLAMAEYVPGSQVLVGGKVVTSRGVLRHFISNEANDTLGQRGYLSTCRANHITYSLVAAPTACHFCGEPLTRPPTHLLLPRHGFVSAGWDPPVRGLDVKHVGSIEQVSISFGDDPEGEFRVESLGGVPGLSARYRENGEILVFNRGKSRQGFALCTGCGYADSEFMPGSPAQGALRLPSGFEKHAPLTSSTPFDRCWKDGEPRVLRHHTLAARQLTDITMIQVPRSTPRSRSFAETLGRALQSAGARLLEVDSRELGVLVLPHGSSHQVALYDNIPGGVGHVRELLDQGLLWLQEARRVLFLDEEHDRRCLTACLDCILTFDAQQAASQGLLNRVQTLTILDAWLAEASS